MDVFLRRFYGRLSRREAAFANLLDDQLDRQAERVEASAHRSRVNAGVDEGAERHVAADAAETVEMSRTHREYSSTVDCTARPPETKRAIGRVDKLEFVTNGGMGDRRALRRENDNVHDQLSALSEHNRPEGYRRPAAALVPALRRGPEASCGPCFARSRASTLERAGRAEQGRQREPDCRRYAPA